MTLVLLIGLQASGKTTFRSRIFTSPHVVVGLAESKLQGNLEQPRERAAKLLSEAFAAGRDVVVDNTNATREERAVYLEAAKQAGYHAVGYYFRSDFKESLLRNAQRTPAERTPDSVLKATIKKLERPEWAEGFAELYYVYINRESQFVAEAYRKP